MPFYVFHITECVLVEEKDVAVNIEALRCGAPATDEEVNQIIKKAAEIIESGGGFIGDFPYNLGIWISIPGKVVSSFILNNRWGRGEVDNCEAKENAENNDNITETIRKEIYNTILHHTWAALSSYENNGKIIFEGRKVVDVFEPSDINFSNGITDDIIKLLKSKGILK